jgi:Fe(3+) dicitrate transport protein
MAALCLTSKNMKPHQNMKPHHRPMTRRISLYLALSGLLLTSGQAQDVFKTLDNTVIKAESESDTLDQRGWLPEVLGTTIFSGKKTAVLDTDAQAKIVNNNYRQLLSQTPSLLISEESSPLVSIGYRGLNPHRAQFTQMLQDGIPIHADQFGYPEAYYTPPLDTVDRIDFVHGGAALLYGPQPGGALNYVTHVPRKDREYSFRTQHIVGSDDLYSTFSSADGTVGKLGYYLYYNHREGEGFRSANSDFELDNLALKLIYETESAGKFIFNASTYREEHGEPGGLTAANFSAGNLSASRLFDRFELDRDFMSIGYEVEPTPDSFLTSTLWWTDYTRYSARQRGGGFGTLPVGLTSTTNSIETQQFETVGLDTRYRKNWGIGGDTPHTFSTGIQIYHTDSPRTDELGATANAGSGALRRASDREVLYAPVFVENKFTFGKFSITPALRVENFRQKVNETLNLDSLAPLRSKEESDHVFLGGLGVEYAIQPESAIYANISQGYRPQIFSEAVPTGPNQLVNGDLEEGKSIEYELGYKTRAIDWLTLDASVFLLSFEDQIGQVTVGPDTVFQNVGDAIHKGVDVSAIFDISKLTEIPEAYGSLEFYVNATLLDAEFSKGPNDGLTPQYAPSYIFRTGLNYAYEDRAKVTFGGTFVDGHYADDTNTLARQVPAYMVWDLTAEVKVHDNVRLLAGINNIFDESYFSRVRADGIDPADGRNFYVGASLEF